MTDKKLLKGFEVELFTGSYSGHHVGVASEATKDLHEFVKEPDQRNLEYITCPEQEYSHLKAALLSPRQKLREWLRTKDLTILPGSTLSLGNSKKFERSDLSNPYHSFIEKEYGSNVVTTSVHINLGIRNLSMLFSSLRLVRCEAALFLALSACSPFLDGIATGAHSQRWIQFPLTPSKVPLFVDHLHYVRWVETQLEMKTMHNERHLWSSVRPNGPKRPYELNRLELRICDLIINCDLLLAITALLELRVLSLFKREDQMDPLKASSLSIEELAGLCDRNDSAVARSSLDATMYHWENGNKINCKDWIKQILEEVKPLALELNMIHLLHPINVVLGQGNQAMRWLKSYASGASIEFILKESMIEIEKEEQAFRKSKVIIG